MKIDSLDRRLADLEKQRDEPPKIHLCWYDESPNPNAIHIKLRWFDECTEVFE